MKKEYISEKVQRLLGRDAPFLRGPKSKVSLIRWIRTLDAAETISLEISTWGCVRKPGNQGIDPSPGIQSKAQISNGSQGSQRIQGHASTIDCVCGHSGKHRSQSKPHLLPKYNQLCYGLEEWKTGEHVQRTFSESFYRSYYREVLQSLREMEVEEGPVLHTIRNHIFDTGR